MAKPIVEVGQTVYVKRNSWSNFSLNDEDEKLDEYIVTKTNGSSFYCKPKDNNIQFNYRFSNKTKTHKSLTGDILVAYLNPHHYYDMVKKMKKKKELLKEVHDTIEKLSIIELENVLEFIVNNDTEIKK